MSWLAFFAVVLLPHHARAQVVSWEVLVGCTSDTETRLTISCEASLDCTSKNRTLYGCSGTCGGPHLLVDSIVWSQKQVSCICFPSGTQAVNGKCPANNTQSCRHSATGTLPFGCSEMGYTAVCTKAECPAEGITDYTCAHLRFPEGSDSSQRSCHSSDEGNEGEGGGCSMGQRNGRHPRQLALFLLCLVGCGVLRRRRPS